MEHESYVSLETAKMLKEAGFDWECETCYGQYYGEIVNMSFRKGMPGSKRHWVARPTLEVAQRWLREVKNMSVEISFENPGKWSCCVILDTNKGVSFENFWREEFDYDTYEEALEAGIKKALEIILEKGE